MEAAERRILSAMARRFYLEDASKTELADEFAMSRFRVARLLQQARDEGIVTIQVHESDERNEPLSTELAAHLGLDDCIVVRAEESEEDNRRLLARAAARYISSTVQPGDLVGFSWGRTLTAIAEQLVDLPPCTIIGLTGTVGHDVRQSPVEVIRRITGRSRVDAVAVFAPLFAASAVAAETFRSDPAIADALRRYADLSLAVLSIGSWDPPITQLRDLLDSNDHADLAREGAVTETAGIFLRADGSIIDTDATRRRISVSPEELRSTPRVLGAAGSVEKSPAIAAAARSGLLTTLVTDDLTASELLRGPAVEAAPGRTRSG